MKSVCFYFQIHQPFRLKRYRFFEIGNDHYYFDDFSNDDIVTNIAERSYIPMARTLLDMINSDEGDFRCAISVTGTAIEQLQQYVPEFIDLLKKLADTGKVEFLSETYAHSLASLEDTEEFIRQVKAHDKLITTLFGQKPKVLRNTELIYDDDIAAVVSSMGFKGVITEGAKYILGWKSPNFVYSAASAPKLKLLLKNDKLSEDISRRFGDTEWDEYPLTADKYVDWIASLPEDQQIVNIFLSMETFGEFQPRETGVFEFMRALPRFAAQKGVGFMTPSEAVSKLKSVDALSIPYPISWADEARDVSAWKGNTLQKEALNKLYALSERVNLCTDRRLKQDWLRLQSSDHFYYMSTKNLADGSAHAQFSPYESPYAAFTNYMNALADFEVRVNEQYPESIDNEELNSLLLTIRNQAEEIELLNKEVKQLRNNILNAEENVVAQTADAEEKPKKPTAKKTTTKKSSSTKTTAKAEKKVADKKVKK